MIVNGVTMNVNLIAIEIEDFDIIPRMDILKKCNAVIKYRHQTVTSKLEIKEEFVF